MAENLSMWVPDENQTVAFEDHLTIDKLILGGCFIIIIIIITP